MKKLTGNTRNLESFKAFPYIAWALVIGFGVFVYSITVTLQAAADELQINSEFIANTVRTPVQEIKSFEPPTQ